QMFRFVATRTISPGRLAIESPGCLSYLSRRFLQNYLSQSNGNRVTSSSVSVDMHK
ncbi:unnamed protein product, partial [Rotaria socialis]